MTDYWTFDACTFCGFKKNKNIMVLDKEFNPHDFDSLGDATEYITTKLIEACQGCNTMNPQHVSHVLTQIIQTIKLLNRIQALQANVVMAKAMATMEFLKKYGPYMEALKQHMDSDQKK